MRLAPMLLLCVFAAAQTTAPVFEAADVHVSPAGASESTGFLPGGRVEIRAATMLRLITLAYSVPADRVVGGPNWMDFDRFDAIAQAAPSVPQIGLRTMLQGLLAERFGLVIQREDKPVPVYALTPGKRGAPKESAGTADPDCKRAVEENVISLTCRNMTIAALAESLPGIAPGYFNHPVVDRSGLKGAYDFTLRWVGRGMLPPGSEGNSLSLFTAIEKQFGVKVEQESAPMPVLTVAHVNRTPTENSSDAIAKLGPPPTEFDVAEIRPSAPGTNEDFNMNNGRIQARAISLNDLIAFAFNVEDDAVKGEKWLDSARFDIVAKTAPTASEDTLRVMLRSLLAERFSLKVHKDMQPLSVYGLIAVKSKLKDAEPNERSTCQRQMADGARNFTCTNITMAQFAERLRPVAVGYLDHPVVDLTGLKGSYDFVLSWSPLRQTAGRAPAAASGGGEGAAAGSGIPTVVSNVDPPVGITLFEAVDRQLGLKLVAQKHSMPVVVVDHMERKPSEN
jgi:uncharacterized protein (TIGR03435 family)